MTTLKLHNTMTRKKEDFAPIDANDVRMYVCGPTVYDRAHLGNARPVVVFDVLYRLLRHVYGADHVTYVRNFTDVDDKINARALENVGSGGDVDAEIVKLTSETTQWFLEDMAAVGALEPSIRGKDHEKAMPRATQYIPEMVTMIEKLITDGFAYAKDGHVLFRVRKYDEYGKLSGRSVDDMIAGARVEIAPYKEDPMDFVLWKPSTADLPGWDSPWGQGRPGWHIECSAMSFELLGESFDIHGGGNDLMFPHHENEIAQSACVHPHGGFANVWLHNEMLQVEGKKMSKSLGNFFTVRELLEQGVSGEVIRFVFLSTHYRKPMNWTTEKAETATKTLRDWYRILHAIGYTKLAVQKLKEKGQWAPSERVLGALANDLNTHQALVEVMVLGSTGKLPELAASLELLGFVDDWDLLGQKLTIGQTENQQLDLGPFEGLLLDARTVAIQTKDFSVLDRLKTRFVEAGLEVRMSKAGVELVPGPGFDPSKLEAML